MINSLLPYILYQEFTLAYTHIDFTHTHTLTHIQFPEHPYGDLLDKLLLFKHTGDNILSPLTDEDTIEDGTIIDIVLKGKSEEQGYSVQRYIYVQKRGSPRDFYQVSR